MLVLTIVIAFLTITHCHPTQSCADQNSDPIGIPQPPPSAESFPDSCVLPKGDRLDVVPKSSLRNSGDRIQKIGTAFIAQDLCAMGHTPKDAAVLVSYLMLEGKDSGVQHLLFGNQCMTRSLNSGNNKRSPVWHLVLKHWLLSVLNERKGVEVTYYEDYNKNTPVCFDLVVIRRKERFRWFAAKDHCSTFRTGLLQYFNLSASLPKHTKPKVTILRRDEDRHFNETSVAQFLSTMYSKVATIELVTFDRVRSGPSFRPPTHKEQLTILSNTDVLIAAHGAGLSSVVVMPPWGVVIELFPNNFRYPMYEELSRGCGLEYIAVESPIVWPKGCCGGRGAMPVIMAPNEVNGINARPCKKCDVYVTNAEWMNLLNTALRKWFSV